MNLLKRNFIVQQGFDNPDGGETCSVRYGALQFQPRMVGIIVLLGIWFQSSAIFLVLSLLLWGSALFPAWNPFEAVYNHTLGRRPSSRPLSAAPVPRRFAQGMAGAFAAAIASCLHLGWSAPAHILQGLFIAALSALIFGGFCFGSFIYHILRGQSAFDIRTLPWKK